MYVSYRDPTNVFCVHECVTHMATVPDNFKMDKPILDASLEWSNLGYTDGHITKCYNTYLYNLEGLGIIVVIIDVHPNFLSMFENLC